METITVTVSDRGYIVLPASLRKKMEIKPGSKMLISQDKDTLILKAVPSFTDKLTGLTQNLIANNSKDVDIYIDGERKDQAE